MGLDMELFEKELAYEDIQFRDDWQFELKSEFSPLSSVRTSVYSQELYFFIPKALQINHNTYSKVEFYKDQTNHIRYRTPVFTFESLLDLKNQKSPLNRLGQMILKKKELENICDELKLLGNIIRSALRNTSNDVLVHLESGDHAETSVKAVQLCDKIRLFLDTYESLHQRYLEADSKAVVLRHFSHVKEFMQNTCQFHLTGLLKKIRHAESPDLKLCDDALCTLIELTAPELKTRGEHLAEKQEYILHRKGLLNKFVLNCLFLDINRSSLKTAFQSVIAGFSAAIAMLVYVLIILWQGGSLVINSEPFILLSVLVYVLKDRLKESLKTLSHRHAFKWLPDYTTKIRSSDEKNTLGKLKEGFSFLNEKNLPSDIKEERNRDFHVALEHFPRPETIFHYKRKVILQRNPKTNARRKDLNILFRLNIRKFLNKASNALYKYDFLDKASRELLSLELPKVYHVNLVMKNQYVQKDLTIETELKKFRLIVDKNGIKRVEQIKGDDLA